MTGRRCWCDRPLEHGPDACDCFPGFCSQNAILAELTRADNTRDLLAAPAPHDVANEAYDMARSAVARQLLLDEDLVLVDPE